MTETPPLPTRWRNTYTGTLGLLGVIFVISQPLLRPGASASIAALVTVGFGGLLIAVSVGGRGPAAGNS